MTGTASILSRTIAALTALLLAAGLFAWMNTAGDGINDAYRHLSERANVDSTYGSSWLAITHDRFQIYAERGAEFYIATHDAHGEELENSFGLILCFDTGWYVTEDSVYLLPVFGAFAALLAMLAGLPRIVGQTLRR